MALDPQASFILDAVAKAEADGRPRMETLSPDAARRMYRDARGAMSPEPPEVGQVEALTAPGPGGPIPLRSYRPLGCVAAACLPVLVYFHGGGWVFGDLDSHDVICRQLANAGGFAVFSVDYRLAPESKFPAAVDDAFRSFNGLPTAPTGARSTVPDWRSAATAPAATWRRWSLSWPAT